MTDVVRRPKLKRPRFVLDRAHQWRSKWSVAHRGSDRSPREASLEQSLRDAEQRVATLTRLAYIDEVCGIPNRRAFNDELRRTHDLIERYGGSYAVVILDVDRFKAINDSHGHAIGDVVLLAIAQEISASVRASDFAARIGGDEFGIILNQLDEDRARAKADDIARRIAALQIRSKTGVVRVTCSAGVSALGRPDIPDALVRADKAMFRQKRTARETRVHVWTD